MKSSGKFLIALFIALATLVSCEEESLTPENGITESQPITFNLTAGHPDATKAVKTGWENGDAIFVFFSGATPNGTNVPYLKMEFNGTQWTSTEMNGAAASPGSLGLNNGDTGTMRAVFLPFGSNLTVLAGENNSFKFSETQYTYYLTAAQPYEVKNNKVSGSFGMRLPVGTDGNGYYVQFFIDDASATSGDYTLGCDAVIPTGVSSIDADGTVNESEADYKKVDIPGYAYSGGYLFSGKINPDYSAKRWVNQTAEDVNAYYFAKTKVSDGSRHDYFVTGKTLTPNSAVKLPTNDNVYESESYGADGKWIPVGQGKFVNFYYSSLQPYPNFAWATCNYGASKPEEIGERLSFNDAKESSGYFSLPSPTIFKSTFNDASFKKTYITVHGKKGFVISASRGFFFLPVTTGDSACDYWSSESRDENYAWYLHFPENPNDGENPESPMSFQSKVNKLAVRMLL